MLSPFEWMIAKRYLWPGKGEAFIALVAAISVGVVSLSVALLVVVMSVMNGFRGELLDKITGLNGHAVVQAVGGRIDDWQGVMGVLEKTPGVISATPMIDKPLLVSFNGNVEGILLRGQTEKDLAGWADKVLLGDIAGLSQPPAPEGFPKVAVGSRLAQNLGMRVGDVITIINPAGRSTPFGTTPRQVPYEVGAIFEIGISTFDEKYIMMPLAEAQSLLLMGDSVAQIEVNVDNPDKVGEILAPVREQLSGNTVISDWKSMNSALFEALQVERVAMFFALSFMVVVASFNILSSLVMLVRAKTRDIAILRTMGATRGGLIKIFMVVGTTIGALGMVAGLVLGFIFLFYRQSVVNFIQLITGQNLWDPSIRFLTELPSKPNPVEIVVIAVMALVLSFLATLYPAFKAANTDPVQVLRYE